MRQWSGQGHLTRSSIPLGRVVHSILTVALLSGEVIRMIPGLEGYAATTNGRIFSLNPRRRNPAEIHGTVYGRGYRNVTIEGKSFYVHRLVALTFLGPPPKDKPYACHNDGNGGNNRIENLRWDSQRGNLSDCESHGTLQHGEKHYATMLTAKIVKEMREQFSANATTVEALAAKFNLSQSGISMILRGRRWARAGGPVQANTRRSTPQARHGEKSRSSE